MDSSVLQFPLPLLLLIHLHILEYPHVNDPEYDINVFNPRTRGLRDRARSMQDIFYFLVGKIERTKARVQKVPGNYNITLVSDRNLVDLAFVSLP